MLIAGEASGDAHAAALVQALRRRLVELRSVPSTDAQPRVGSFEPYFFGAGGPRMAEAGVALDVEMTSHAVVGLLEVVRKLGTFRALGRRLLDLACQRLPEVIVLVDFSGFNRRFAAELRRRVRSQRGIFANWNPKIVYFISPQVWASREGRAYQLARDVDLLLSIFPFEKAWYAQRVPGFRVEYVGHPIVDRYAPSAERQSQRAEPSCGCEGEGGSGPVVVLLPGSRAQEVRRHLPIMAEAIRQLRRVLPVRPWMALPNEAMFQLARQITPVRRADEPPESQRTSASSKAICCRVGRVEEMLARADLAIAKSGSITLECSFFCVPTVVMYRVSWLTWWVAERIVKVPYAAMPNILANKEIFPECLQANATPERIAREAADLLQNHPRRAALIEDLKQVNSSLGEPGACDRAAQATAQLLAAGLTTRESHP